VSFVVKGFPVPRDHAVVSDPTRFDLYLLVSLAMSGGAHKPPSTRI